MFVLFQDVLKTISVLMSMFHKSMDDIIQLTEETINVSPWSIPTFNNFEWEYLVEPPEK